MSSRASLGDLVTIQRGTTYKSALLGHPGPVLLGLASIVRNGGFRDDSLRTYGGESPDNLLVRPGEIFASLKDVTQSADLLGSVARVPPDGQVGRLTQDTVRLDVISPEVDPAYLYRSLLTPEYREYCRAHATGTTNLGLPRSDFLAYEIRLPTIEGQRRIAVVLDAFDELIEVNRSTMTHLRSLAVAALDAASANGEVATFADIAVLVRDGVSGHRLKPGTRYLGLEHFGTDGAGLTGAGDAGAVDSNKFRFQAGDVLYGKLRPYFRKVDRPGFDGVCSTELWVLRPTVGWGAATLHAVVARPEFTDFAMAGNTGTRMPRASWAHVATLEVPVPTAARRNSLNQILEELWLAGVALSGEIDDLTRTRNDLLPLLMSGRVRVSDDFEVA